MCRRQIWFNGVWCSNLVGRSFQHDKIITRFSSSTSTSLFLLLFSLSLVDSIVAWTSSPLIFNLYVSTTLFFFSLSLSLSFVRLHLHLVRSVYIRLRVVYLSSYMFTSVISPLLSSLVWLIRLPSVFVYTYSPTSSLVEQLCEREW